MTDLAYLQYAADGGDADAARKLAEAKRDMRRVQGIDDAEPDDDGTLPLDSDQALAGQFAADAQDVYRWSPGLGWMHNDGTHWERDETLTRFSLAKSICRQVARDHAQRARQLVSAKTVAAMLDLARSEPSIATPITAWDAHPMLLNTPGGAIDLETGQPARGSHLFRQVTSVAPDADCTPARWLQFLQQITGNDPDVIEFLQRLAGYCLTGNTREQKVFFLHGPGGNGKSVFTDVLEAIAGVYAVKMPAEALMTRAHADHPTVYARLFGKRLAVSAEIESNAHWAEAKIKELTGDATVTARFMRQDYFTFPSTHKHVIHGNYRPRLRGDDFAMARRLVLIPFSQRFEGKDRDQRLPDKLRAEYPGILAWCIAGAVKWNRDGLHIPDSIASASEAYMRENDDVAQWLADCCTITDGEQTLSSTLYASFAQWKESAGEHAPSIRAFSQQLERKGFQKERTRNGKVFVGIRCETSAASYAQAKWGEA